MACEQMRQRLYIGGGQVGRGSAVPLTGGGCPSCPPDAATSHGEH